MNAVTCPVCRGRGFVDQGFYRTTTGMWSSGGTATERCRSCDGRGYVVVPEIRPAVPAAPPSGRHIKPTTMDTAGTITGSGNVTVS